MHLYLLGQLEIKEADMNIAELKKSAEALKQVLAKYAPLDPEAKYLQDSLSSVIDEVLADKITAPIAWASVPGGYYFNEGSLRKYDDLETAFAEFKIELSGGESPVLRQLRLDMENKKT